MYSHSLTNRYLPILDKYNIKIIFHCLYGHSVRSVLIPTSTQMILTFLTTKRSALITEWRARLIVLKLKTQSERERPEKNGFLIIPVSGYLTSSSVLLFCWTRLARLYVGEQIAAIFIFSLGLQSQPKSVEPLEVALTVVANVAAKKNHFKSPFRL